jgi:hypothetical protein
MCSTGRVVASSMNNAPAVVGSHAQGADNGREGKGGGYAAAP